MLGASPKAERTSYLALARLLDQGYPVIGIHPLSPEIHGLKCLASLDQVDGPIHTLTLYVGPAQQPTFYEALLRSRPNRVIFNPGTENPELELLLETNHIKYQRACTLVLLSTGQYEKNGEDFS